MDHASSNCLNCGTPLQGVYCHRCGQKHIPREKWGVVTLLSEFFENVTNLDNKVFNTFKDVLIRPGVVARRFNEGQRRRYASPVRLLMFIFIVVFLYPLITDFTQNLSSHLHYGFLTTYGQSLIDAVLVKTQWDMAKLDQVFTEQQSDVGGVLVFLHIPFFALSLWVLHPQRRYFFIDHVVASSFFLVFLMLYLYANIVLIGLPLMYVVEHWLGYKDVPLGQWLNLILLKIPFFFFMWAYLKYAYAQTWVAAAWRAIPAGIGFFLAHMLYRTTTFYVTLIWIHEKSV